MAGYSSPQGRSGDIDEFAAGTASRTYTVPKGAVGCYVVAANAYSVQLDATGAVFRFAAGQVSFYIPVQDHTSVVVADQAASDTGVTSCFWEIGE